MRNNKKYAFCFLTLLGLIISSVAFAASPARDALEALLRLKSQIKVGVVYKDYLNLLGEANYKVDSYLGASSSKKNQNLAASLSKALSHYKMAVPVWETKFTGYPSAGSIGPEEPLYKELVSKYPGIDRDYESGGATAMIGSRRKMVATVAMKLIWKEAEREIQTAQSIMNK